MGLALETSIRQLKGVGDRRAAQYEKLGIRRVDDLLRHYPRSYEDWSAVVPIAGAPVGRPCCIRGTPLRAPGEHVVRRGLTLYKFAVSDGENQLQVTLFNNKYAAAKVRAGEPLLLFGTVVRGPRHFEMASPLLEPAEGGDRIRPIYRQTEGLTSRMIEANVAQAFQLADRELDSDPLPADLRREHSLAARRFALENIHFPADSEWPAAVWCSRSFFCCSLGFSVSRDARGGRREPSCAGITQRNSSASSPSPSPARSGGPLPTAWPICRGLPP